LNNKKIELFVKDLIDKSRLGQEIEFTKIDFKYKWYNLKDSYGENEFIKDVTAIANSRGENDGFIIIGFAEKSNKFNPSKFADSGLKDAAELINLIEKNCSDIFEVDVIPIKIDGNDLNVIHIFNVNDKPIVISKFKKFYKKDVRGFKKGEFKSICENCIFIRKGPKNLVATKKDIEFMFKKKWNIAIDFDYQIELLKHKFSKQTNGQGLKEEVLEIELVIENLGQQSFTIKSYDDLIFEDEEKTKVRFMPFGKYKSPNVIMAKGEVKKLEVKFINSSAPINESHKMMPIKFVANLTGNRTIEDVFNLM